MRSLSLKCWTAGNTLLSRVEGMGDFDRGRLHFVASNGFKIDSEAYPDIYPFERTLNVWGNDKLRDKEIFFFEFRSLEELKNFVRLMREAIQEYNRPEIKVDDALSNPFIIS